MFARPQPARPGLSLLEVLIAIFVMAVGTVSILVLFPLGLLNVKWALDNEQVARAAANGQVLTEVPHAKIDNSSVYPTIDIGMQTLRVDEAFRPQKTNSNSPWWRLLLPNVPAQVNGRLGRDHFLLFSPDPFTVTPTWTFSTAIDPVTLTTMANGPGIVPGAIQNPPGLPGTNRMVLPPVLVDPAVASNPSLNTAFNPDPALPPQFRFPFGLPFHVGATVSPRLPFANHGIVAPVNRYSLGLPRFATAQYRADNYRTDLGLAGVTMETEVSMGDEVVFARNGRPEVDSVTKRFPASRRFSWAYMCRWPDYTNPDVCDVSMVCFNGRPLQSSAFTGNPPGEESFLGSAIATVDAGFEVAGVNNYGRVFIKGSATAVLLPNAATANIKPGDWILDSTFMLPDFDPNNPGEVAPFLDQYSPATFYQFPIVNPQRQLRPGLCGGHFYKVVDISAPRTVGIQRYQVLTLDRPARSDGFVGTVFAGATDVIEKGIGRMPEH